MITVTMTIKEFNKQMGGGTISVSPQGVITVTHWMYPSGSSGSSEPSELNESAFGMHIREAVRIVKDWYGTKRREPEVTK